MNRIFLCLFIAFFCSSAMVTLEARCSDAADEEPCNSPGQSTDSVIIRSIIITGNQVTKKAIILREIEFKEKDTLQRSGFSSLLGTSKQNIFNTRLFNFVTVDTTCSPDLHMVDVHIRLVERWYIWPIPFFEISDRNFNVWWETRDFNRLTYGVNLTFFNARGRNEKLRILAHFGFNQKFGFDYNVPYVNKKQTLGVGFGAAVELNRELAVYTLNNEPVYLRSNSIYLKKMAGAFAEVSFRPDMLSTNTFRISYSRSYFDSAVRVFPGFMITPEPFQQFISLAYLLKIDHRDVHYYPLKGFYADAEVNHSIPYEAAHNTFLMTNLKIYLQFYYRWYWASGFTGRISIAREQPYNLQRSLGYGKYFVRGYEYYVVGGQHFAILKNNLKFAIVPQRIKKIGFIQTTKFNTIPLALYMNAFVDAGFAYRQARSGPESGETGNSLENSLMIGYGLGLDFTTYYDVVIRVELSVNRMNRTGVYIHFVAPI